LVVIIDKYSGVFKRGEHWAMPLLAEREMILPVLFKQRTIWSLDS